MVVLDDGRSVQVNVGGCLSGDVVPAAADDDKMTGEINGNGKMSNASDRNNLLSLPR